jgi:glycerophosphoryl diester phosphodiesterase
MPIVSLSSKSAKTTIDDYLENRLPVAFEMIIPQDSLELVDYFSEIKSKGSSIWVNSLWSSLCAGHTDEKAAKNPAVYDWYIEHGVDIIQTDNPQLLIEYLREKGLHR